MANYLPSTAAQQKEMLAAVGLQSLDELFAAVPQHLIQPENPDIPAGLPEFSVIRKMRELAEANTVFPTVFRGAGAYRHYIPAIVDTVTSKETFLTAYTPYQAEMAQGILQSIFEYQTMIAELTGLDVSNASVYDGASAAAEAAAMCRDRKRTVTLVSETAHPDVIETVRTYCWAGGSEMRVIPAKDGRTDPLRLREMLTAGDVSGVYAAQPNYFGLIEDCEKIAETVHAAGAKFIMGINPIAAAVLKSPGECGADIAVGEGQPLGMPLAFGGPYLGFMAASDAMARKLPGRIVGETADAEGRRVFVLTLQAREQHIRREKASSNVCSNQALCAMTAAVYLAAMGSGGLRETAEQCFSKAHYLAAELEKIGFARRHRGEFFHEFVTGCPADFNAVQRQLAKNGILAGLPVSGGVLWCATEMNTKDEIDRAVSLIREVM